MKLTEPLETIIKSDFLNLKQSQYQQNLAKVKVNFISKTDNQISFQMIEDFDKNTNIMNIDNHDGNTTLYLPMMIKNLSNSPDTLLFIQEKGTDFIKSMRDEVDNENLDIINKLDVINKNIGFMVQEKNIERILELLVKIPKIEQRKIKSYINSIEGLISTHIVHLADKTKKDSGYNKKTINCILTDSIFKLYYNVEERDFVIQNDYMISTTKFLVDSIELSELFNKAKIIVSENANLDELDDYQLLMAEFNSLGKEISDMITTFKQFRHIGLINHKFRDLIKFLNQGTGDRIIFDTH